MRLQSLFSLIVCLAAVCGQAAAATPTPLHTDLTLTHTAPGTWRADYVFDEPVSALELGPQVGAFRKEAWRPLSPGLTLVQRGNEEVLEIAGKPLSKLSIEIKAYRPFAEGNYSPINRFSNGASDFFLGFLYADLKQGAQARTMDVALHLRGLAGETVVAPAKPGTDLQGYAYFGLGAPVDAGIARTLIDPATPAWLVAVLEDTVAKVSKFYASAFERPLAAAPLVSAALVGTDGRPGNLSIKGGAVGGGVVFRLEGEGLLADTPGKRQMFATLVAHELAHVWQQNVQRGGIGEAEPWIHEGGAEAIMLEAMRATAILPPAAVDQLAGKLIKECDALKDDITVYRGFYACGFKRFQNRQMPVMALWKALMLQTETTGEVYSSSMIEAIAHKP
jgi:hypothetical protein